MEEIELLDGASADFDQELVDKGELDSGILRFRSDQLRRGNFPEAFPQHDDSAASEKSGYRCHRSDERRFFCLCVQDSGKYEQGTPRPYRFHADLLR